jgi:hypothetical protein
MPKVHQRFRAMEVRSWTGGRQVEQVSAEELNAVWNRKEAARLER